MTPRLVFSNGAAVKPRREKRERISPLQRKLGMLECRRPIAAGVVERLIDDLLVDQRTKGGA